MALVRAQVALQPVNALPQDVTVNTFHFSTADLLDATLDAIDDALVDFYTAINAHFGNATFLQSFFSTQVAQNGHTVTMYDLGTPKPRVPLRTTTWNLGVSPNGDPLPGEVAVCMSFQGEKVAGQPQSRRRGRIYFGRLDKDSASAGRPSATLMTCLAAAGRELVGRSDLAGNWSWIVLSPAFDGMIKDVDGNIVPHPTREAYPETFAVVHDGWVDNEFDTQRGRGLVSTARTLFTL